jgi:hypothetical protein
VNQPPAFKPAEPADDIKANPQLMALWNQLTGLEADNTKGLQELAQLGGMVNPLSLLELRLNVFLGFMIEMMPQEQRSFQALQFEIRFQTTMKTMISQSKGEIRKANLGVGGQLTPEQIAQMAKAAEQATRARGNGGGGLPPGFGG